MVYFCLRISILKRFFFQKERFALTRPLRRKLRMRWFFDVSKVKESSFFQIGPLLVSTLLVSTILLFFWAIKSSEPHIAQKNNELTVTVNSIATVIKKQTSGWWKVKVGSNIGLLPATILKLSEFKFKSWN